MGRFEKDNVVVRRKRWWVMAIYFVVGGSTLAAGFERLLAGHPDAFLLIGGVGLAIMIVLCALWAYWPREERTALRAEETGLFIGSRFIARHSIKQVRVRHRRGVTFVRFVRWRPPVDVVVDNDEEACAFLRAMRLDPANAVEPFTLNIGTARSVVVRTTALVVGTFVLTMGLLPIVMIWWPMGVSVEVAILVVYLFLLFRTRVTAAVGADGVRFRRWLGRTRFVPYTEIATARLDDTSIELSLLGGAKWTLSMGTRRGARLLGIEEDARSFVERITERIALHNGAAPAAAIPGTGRAGRTTRQWIDAMRAMGDGQAFFREAAFPRDKLWRVVEDPKVAQDARAGAAVALRSGLDEDGRSRLRAAAQACAAPRLRTALEAAASPDDAAFARSIDPFDDEVEQPSARGI